MLGRPGPLSSSEDQTQAHLSIQIFFFLFILLSGLGPTEQLGTVPDPRWSPVAHSSSGPIVCVQLASIWEDRGPQPWAEAGLAGGGGVVISSAGREE